MFRQIQNGAWLSHMPETYSSTNTFEFHNTAVSILQRRNNTVKMYLPSAMPDNVSPYNFYESYVIAGDGI